MQPRPNRRAYRSTVRLAALMGALIVALALVELGLALWLPDEELLLNNAFYLPDPELGLRPKPNFHSGGLDINGLGMRGREISRSKAEGTFRILLLGDSFAFGVNPDPSRIFASLLERGLQKLRPSVELLNAGVPTWGTVQEARYLRREGLALGPDLILLALYIGNDIADDSSPQPFYTAVNGYILPTTSAKSDWRLRLQALLHHSRLYRLLRYRTVSSSVASGTLDRMYAGALSDGSAWLEELRRDQHRKQPKHREVLIEGWRRTFDALARIQGMARERGIAVGVILIPDDLQLNPHWRIVMQTLGEREADYDFGAATRRLLRFCESRRLPVLDLSEALAPRYQKGSRPYGAPGSKVGGHFNEEGDWIAARQIQKFLLQTRLFTPGPGSPKSVGGGS